MHEPFSTSDLFKWRNHNPVYQEDPLHRTELFIPIFATHHPSWEAMHALINMMLAGDERRMTIDKAREEAYQFHLADLDGTPEANLAVPNAEPDGDPNNGAMPHLEHYRKFYLSGSLTGGA